MMIDHAAYFWGPEVAADLMDVLTEDWPPPLDQDGNPYPADAKDEWLYRLGVYRALAGDELDAVDLLTRYLPNLLSRTAVGLSRRKIFWPCGRSRKISI